MPRIISIIGGGVVGAAVAALLRSKGYEIKGVVSRNLGNAERAVRFIGGGEPGTDAIEAATGADWIFITTPDRAIKPVCDDIAARGGFDRGVLVVHFSGALGSGILGSARAAGAHVISIHPIQSLASVEQAMANLPGSYFSLEGDPDGIASGREIIEALGGMLVEIPGDQKALYHAGAAVASNYLVTVVDFAVQIYEMLGMKREDAVQAALPLIRGTVNNIARVGVPDALTGPIARGDVETVSGHIETLGRTMPDKLRLYIELGRHTVDVARAKGSIAEEDAKKLMELFDKS